MSAEPKERRGKIQLLPSLYFGREVKREAALVLLNKKSNKKQFGCHLNAESLEAHLRKTGPVLVQYVEIESREASRERCEDELALFCAATFACVQVFAT